MTRGRTFLVSLLALAPLVPVGCVERKFVVVSNPSGATVLVNNQPLNTYTPADGSFLYHGNYHITVIADQYERLDVNQPVPAKWYDYPPLDFIAENLIPWTIHDNRVFGPYCLKPLQIATPEEAIRRGEYYRQRSQGVGGIGSPPGALAPPPPPPPTSATTVLPPVTPSPGGTP